MKIMKSIFIVIIAVIAIITLFYFLLIYTIGIMEDVSVEVASSFVIAFGSVIAIIITYLISKSKDRAEAHRDKKIEIYTRFINKISDMMVAEREAGNNKKPRLKKKGKSGDLDDLIEFAVNFHKDIVLWASPDVIRSYQNFRNTSENSKNKHDLIFAMDEVLKSMRKDLGLSNFGLGKGEIVGVFLKDPSELK